MNAQNDIGRLAMKQRVYLSGRARYSETHAESVVPVEVAGRVPKRTYGGIAVVSTPELTASAVASKSA